MSFGFGIGDFVAVIQLGKKILDDFVGAPSQFKAISEEFQILVKILEYLGVELSDREIDSKQKAELQKIADCCKNTLHDVQNTLKKYKGLGEKSAIAVLRRFKWNPVEIRDLRHRITSNILLLNNFDGRVIKRSLIRLTRRKDEAERQETLNWLSSVNFATQQADYIRRRQAGTGKWFLESPDFRTWTENSKQTLFCPGIPGAGKTILTSMVVEDLELRYQDVHSVGIAYLYCDFRRGHEQSVEGFMANILKQFACRLPSIPEDIKIIQKRKGESKSIEDIRRLLVSTASLFDKGFIIIDALDEFSSRGGLITEIFKLQKQVNVNINILITSRCLPDIIAALGGKPSLEIRADSGDVGNYLKEQLEELPFFVSAEKDPPDTDINKITKSVDGMFLLAKLYVDFFKTKTSTKQFEVALRHLPSGSDAYDHAYDQLLGRIESQSTNFKELANRVLIWMTFSRRPLNTVELQHALAVEMECNSLDEDNISPLDLIISVCAGLVAVDKESDVIRLVHYTTHEYLERTWTTWFPDAHLYLAQVCIKYLSYNQFAVRVCTSWGELTERLTGSPLYDYAARHWGYHARDAYSKVEELVVSFLQSSPALASSIQPLFSGSLGLIPTWIIAIHPAAHFGLNRSIPQLLGQLANCNDQDSHGQTALHWAVKGSQTETVELLLQKGSDINMADTNGRTALHYAASDCDEHMIHTLLKHRPHLELKDKEGLTPFLTAAKNAKLRSVELLLDGRAAVNTLDYKNRNALHLTIITAKGDGIQLTGHLLSQGVRTDVCDVDNMTPLHYAVRVQNEDIANILLQYGVDINIGCDRKVWDGRMEGGRTIYTLSQNREYSPQVPDAVGLTPLHFAALTGRPEMIKFLLSKGANPNARCQRGETPLHLAVRRDTPTKPGLSPDAWDDDISRIEALADFIDDYEGEEAMETYRVIDETRKETLDALLSDEQVNVDIQNVSGQSALHLASDEGSRTYELSRLIDKNANINTREEKGKMPLHLACRAGNTAMVSRLLVAGATLTMMDSEGLTPFQYAVYSDRFEAAELILTSSNSDSGICQQKDEKGRSLLHNHLASSCCSVEMVRILLNHGASIDEIDAKGNSPLSLYLGNFHFITKSSICQLLLDNGADPFWRDGRNRNLSHISMGSPCIGTSREAHQVLDVLMNAQVDISAKDADGRGILHHAAIHGSVTVEVLEFLYQNDSSFCPYDMDRHGKTPLSYAEEEASRPRHPYLWRGNRWAETVKVLKVAIERWCEIKNIDQPDI
ncbi:hypothetical protein AWENTII_010289 [Aspergillus wentii]|nr:hypothetical protein MW887_009481 [Aspergillus wentii]